VQVVLHLVVILYFIVSQLLEAVQVVLEDHHLLLELTTDHQAVVAAVPAQEIVLLQILEVLVPRDKGTQVAIQLGLLIRLRAVAVAVLAV